MIKKIKSFGKKIISGDDLVKIKYTKEGWDEQFENGNWDFLLNDHENIVLVTNELNKLASAKQGEKLKVLDVGCGNGALAKRLSSELFDYRGTDISDKAIETARQEVPWGTFYQSSMDDTPQTAEKYDVIIFCEVLVYGDYEKVLEQYSHLLKAEGHLVISLYDVWRTKLIWRTIKKKLNIVNSVSVVNTLRNVGWNIVVAQYINK
jgi:2-polyprenyl-3-methyl-5-hydroxy-6-metoxy-1,4-benzoquinol methylase